MLLRELLQTIPNAIIKVGANSSFVYCGANDKVANSFFEEKDLLNRQVIHCIDSFAYFEPNTKIIKIAGEENGRYWTTKEFARALKKLKAKYNM